MTKYLSILLVVIRMCMTATYAQTIRPYAESLAQVEDNAPDSVRIRANIQLSMYFAHRDGIRGMDYASKAVRISEKDSSYDNLVKAYVALAINEKSLNMKQNATAHLLKALSLARQHCSPGIQADVCNNIAFMHLELYDTDSIEPYIREAMSVAKATKNLSTLSAAYINLGMLEYVDGDLDSSIAHVSKAYGIRHDRQCMASDDLDPLYILAKAYEMKHDYAKAKEMLFTDLNNNRCCQLADFSSRVWMKLATIYYHTGMPDSALIAASKAADESVDCHCFERFETAYKLMDSVYLSTGRYQEAANTCSRFSAISDTFYNSIMADNIRIIQHTFDYQENEESLEKSLGYRTIWLAILIFVLLALIVVVPAVIKLSVNNHKIDKLNEDMNIRLQNKIIELYVTHSLQMSLQPAPEEFGNIFRENFIIYMPREIVSGDFFWKYSSGCYEVIAVADCTGHGMPGAMLTMLGISTLQHLVSTGELRSDVILERLRFRIKQLMSTNALNKMQDGMDISLMVINRITMQLDFAGAYNCLYYIRDGKMQKLAADRCPIGEYVVMKPFTSKKLQVQTGDTIYMMTDGYWSQFGGPDNVKIGKQNFLDMLLEIHGKPMEEQYEYLTQYFSDWKSSYEQVDDVTIAGFRV